MHHSNMGRYKKNEKDINVAFEKLSITSSNQTSSQIKINSEDLPPLQSHMLFVIHKIRKSKNMSDVKAITKKVNKTSSKSFDES